MKIQKLAIADVLLVEPPRFEDERGAFAETWNRRTFEKNGITTDFVQDNWSRSRIKGTVRGLHFQRGDAAQAKLVRVLKGAIFDVALDIREDSPTYGQHISVVLDAKVGAQLLVPIGFAHGFCTLEPDTEVMYKASNFYTPAAEGGVFWNDPALQIPWPITDNVVLAERDKQWPLLSRLQG